MRRLFTTMYRLYFFARISYWLFGAGIALAAASFFIAPAPADGVRILALIFLAGFPLLAVTGLFGTIGSNRHVLLIPYGREFLLGATCSLALLLSLLLSWGVTLIDKPNQPGFVGVFLTVFCLGSLVTVLTQGAIGRRLVPFVAWIIVVIFLDLSYSLWNQLPRIDTPMMHAALVLIILTSWSWLALRIRPLEKKSFVPLAANDSHSRLENLAGQSSKPIQLSSFLTVLKGFPLSQTSPLSNGFVPLLAVLVTAVLFLWFATSSTVSSHGLLAIPFMTVVILPVISAEWIARLRCLWLKIPGDRLQFWRLWKKRLHAELLLLIVILSIYAAALKLIFGISSVSLALYAVITFLLFPSLCYSAAWFRLKGGLKNGLAVWSGITYLLTVAFLIVATYVNETHPSIVGLGLLSGGIYLLTYFRVKKDFLNVDWLKVRPILQPQPGFARQ